MSSVAATSAATSGAVAAAAIANATKAYGAIIKLDPAEFKKVLNKTKEPLVAYAVGGFFSKNHQYLTNYKGLFFFCKAKEPVTLPGTVEVIMCEKIWIPGAA